MLQKFLFLSNNELPTHIGIFFTKKLIQKCPCVILCFVYWTFLCVCGKRRWWICLMSWLWWWYHRCMHMSKCINCTIWIYATFYISVITHKGLKRKVVQIWNTSLIDLIFDRVCKTPLHSILIKLYAMKLSDSKIKFGLYLLIVNYVSVFNLE